MSHYIPMPADPSKLPIDISFVFCNEAPAGKHGFLHTEGEKFVFEDGTEVKFWGVNLNGGACFPEQDYAKKVSSRLAQAGCNIVRLHQLDAEWHSPNIFAFSRGQRLYTTRKLDSRSLDRLDYLIHCLKQEGIYIYLDMLTYRKFKEGDGVPEYDLLLDKARPWCMTNPEMIELQKEYATQLWTHYNPYTGLEYRNDPVFVMTEVVNESDLYYDTSSKKLDYIAPVYFENEFRQMFRRWLEERNESFDWERCDLYCTDDLMIRFKLDATKAYYRQIYDHLHSIGVKIPITGTNWTKPSSAIAKANEDMDFSDSHHYYYDYKWNPLSRLCQNRSVHETANVCCNLPRMRLAGKPFMVSEWDMPWPNSYRAEGPIYYPALAALQGWNGLIVHTYSYSSNTSRQEIIGKELSGAIGGIAYREGVFSTWNDPARFGLFYHGALMLRRGDVSPANKRVAVCAHNLAIGSNKGYVGLVETHQAHTVFEDSQPEGFAEIIRDDTAYPLKNPKRLESDNGQMWRDLNKMIGAVDTPRTKICYGMLGRAGSNGFNHKRDDVGIQLDGLKVACSTDFGVIALSSLTDAPMEETDTILLSAVGRVRNSGEIYDGEKMVEPGHPPIVAEVLEADICLRTVHGTKMKVWCVTAEGNYGAKLPTAYENGILSFHIGTEGSEACYYLIVKE